MVKRTPCQVCHHPDGTLRCKRCRSAYYCSVECQRKDWSNKSKGTRSRSHREVCHALRQLDVLQQQTATVPTATLAQEYHRTMDLIETIRNREQHGKDMDKGNTSRTHPKTRSRTNHESKKPTTTATAIVPSFQRIHSFGKEGQWRFGMEMMPRLSCYQITLHVPGADGFFDPTNVRIRPDPEGTTLQIQFVSSERQDDETTLTIQRLPHPMNRSDATIHVVDDDRRYLILRLPYQNGNDDALGEDFCCGQDSSTTMTILDAISQMQQQQPDGPKQLAAQIGCAFCQTLLVPDPDVIQSLAKAPSSRWDELQDYIACGTQADATGLFGKEMQHRKDLILHDAVSLAFSINLSIRACQLYILNYGSTTASKVSEEPVSGAMERSNNKKPMKAVEVDEAMSPPLDATLTCPCCASILGSATATQQRLLLHRISVGTTTTTTNMVPLSCISRFIAHVLIEQAESKAVFALRVVVVPSTDEAGSMDPTRHQNHNTTLLLRLVSWDTYTAVGGATTTGRTLDELTAALARTTTTTRSGDDAFDASTFRRTVKVLFGNATAATFTTHNGKNRVVAEPMMDWTQWTRFDACCAPNNRSGDDTTNSVSSDAFLPCIGLDVDEFHCLERELLAASGLIPQEVATAAATAKMETGVDVSAIQLAAIVV